MTSSALVDAEVLDIESIRLGADTERGLVPAQIAFIKESTVEINEELLTAGQCIRAVAANLFEIKQNVKPGNWKAYLKSGVLNCSERYAVDLANAHEKWLGASSVEDHLLAGLSARSLNALGGKNVTEKQRAKVFDAARKSTKPQTEADVRRIIRGNAPAFKTMSAKSVDERVVELSEKLNAAMKRNKELIEENKKLRELVAHVTP